LASVDHGAGFHSIAGLNILPFIPYLSGAPVLEDRFPHFQIWMRSPTSAKVAFGVSHSENTGSILVESASNFGGLA